MLNKFKEVLESKIPEYGGEIIQFYGDGCLAVFNSSVDCVKSAEAIQHEFIKAPEVPVRVGIHSGDITIEEANIFGDAVNIASRIESMGVPGCVLLSETVRLQIKNQPDLELKPLSKFSFKNVPEKIPVYALKSGKLTVPNVKELVGKFKPNKTKKEACSYQL